MSNGATIYEYMQAMSRNLKADQVGGSNITYQLQLKGDGGGTWTVAIANQQCSFWPGAPARADTYIGMEADNYLRLATGQFNVTTAYQQGQLQVGGNLQLALKFSEFFPPWAPSQSPDPISEPTSPPQPTEPAPPSQPPEPAPPATPDPPDPQPPAAPTVADYVRALPNGFRADRAGDLRVTYQFQLIGTDGGYWTVTIANGTCAVSNVQIESPTVAITLSGDDFIQLAQGAINPTQAYQQGRLQVSGDVSLAVRFSELFGAWAHTVDNPPPQAPPSSPPAPAPVPAPDPGQPSSGPVHPQLLNGSFDEFQPYVRKGEVKVWKEDQFPERYGANWTLQTIYEKSGRRYHIMDSAVFGGFTQKYFRGGGRDYHIHGRHSQVITSRYRFDIVLYQTVAAQPGQNFAFSGSLVSFFQGTSGPPVHDKIFKTIGIDPTGGRDFGSPSVIWGERDGRDNEWRYPSVGAQAQGDAVTVFIRLENEERDVGETELNIIHLDNFELK